MDCSKIERSPNFGKQLQCQVIITFIFDDKGDKAVVEMVMTYMLSTLPLLDLFYSLLSFFIKTELV